VIRQHSNKAHNKKRVADKDLFKAVQLQSWFGEKRERYWVVDDSKQVEQERQTRRARTRDIGEETDDSDHSDNPDTDHSESDQDDVDDQIVQDIENWKTEAQERRLRMLKEVPVVEMDSWLQYTKWNEVLS